MRAITVVWSRPPNDSPISGKEWFVSSRVRYIAICLGMRQFCPPLGPHIRRLISKYSAHFFLDKLDGYFFSSSRTISFKTSFAISSVTSIFQVLRTRLPLLSAFKFSYVRFNLFRYIIEDLAWQLNSIFFGFFCKIAILVSKSGVCMSVTSPFRIWTPAFL